jgi:prepilin-type N-terminal cleavage/methylation domain-containing protein
VSGRHSFTLIELLVVIAIIAVLLSLTTAAAMRVLGSAPRVTTQTELAKMTESLKAAQHGGFGGRDITFFPSYLILFEDVSQYNNAANANNPDVQNSKKVLAQMFGDRILTPGNQVNWNGDGKPNKRTFKLEGQQCLVFYLGGIPYPGQPLKGFANDGANPANPNTSARIGPFYTFETSRLVANADGFYSYNDPYGTPYAFFAARASNVYDQAAGSGRGTDCPSLGVGPYYANPGTKEWANKDTFQIVSAGKDKAFGQGGAVWSAQNGSTDGPTLDNLSNFTKGQMAAPTR